MNRQIYYKNSLKHPNQSNRSQTDVPIPNEEDKPLIPWEDDDNPLPEPPRHNINATEPSPNAPKPTLNGFKPSLHRPIEPYNQTKPVTAIHINATTEDQSDPTLAPITTLPKRNPKLPSVHNISITATDDKANATGVNKVTSVVIDKVASAISSSLSTAGLPALAEKDKNRSHVSVATANKSESVGSKAAAKVDDEDTDER